MGMPFSDYERTVGPLNKQFHENAEAILLYREGVFPLDPDEREEPDVEDPSTSKTRTRHRL